MDCEDFMDLMIVETLHHAPEKEVVVPIQPSRPSKQIVHHIFPLPQNITEITMTRGYRIMESWSDYWLNL